MPSCQATGQPGLHNKPPGTVTCWPKPEALGKNDSWFNDLCDSGRMKKAYLLHCIIQVMQNHCANDDTTLSLCVTLLGVRSGTSQHLAQWGLPLESALRIKLAGDLVTTWAAISDSPMTSSALPLVTVWDTGWRCPSSRLLILPQLPGPDIWGSYPLEYLYEDSWMAWITRVRYIQHHLKWQ